MLVIFPCFSGDVQQLRNLLLWISKLGERKQHCALICADGGTPFDEVISLRELAETIFREVRVTTNGVSVKGWPQGANSLFKTAATYVHEKWPQPFLVMEPDAVPLCSGWLDELEAEYTRGSWAFVGCIYNCSQPFLPPMVMSGVAMYPADTIKRLPLLPQSPRAWDVDGAEVMTGPDGTHSGLIVHKWGEQNLPPTFVAQKTQHSPVNAMTLEDIPGGCVLFHRCKNSSLINLLERKLFPEKHQHELVVCLPVHVGDIGLAIQHANWLRTLKRRWPNEAIICHDPSCPVVLLNQFEQLLRHSFGTINSFVYHRPAIPTYPHAANWMFQSIALHMAKQKKPWLLLEADAVVLKADWLEQLQNEYNRAGMPWMGPHVKGMQHSNGSMIYPANAAQRMPIAMSCSAQAWDHAGAPDYMPECHDGSALLHHVWSVMDGRLCEVGGGQVPANATPELLRQIPASCVVSHRWKDLSALKLLLSGEYKHG